MSLQCYNRGCGQKYDSAENNTESCRHHPGEPVFHDAYKGWSCCSKKCTDFTEFLNIKGCALAKHSNEKPPEPEKAPSEPIPDGDIIVVKPIVASRLERPSYDSPVVTIKPTIAASLKAEAGSKMTTPVKPVDSKIIHVGTTCKHGGCGMTFDGEDSDSTDCIYHPGVPIFHEGLKFWSCCQKRTTDFAAFLNQAGCETGNHVWLKEEQNSDQVECRWDHHQTGTHVVISIYAKQYCPETSTVEINPIRLKTKIVFPQQDNAAFNLDIELKGVVDVDACAVNMFGTKVEIKLKKAEPGTWPRLEVPKDVPKKLPETSVDNITPKVDAVDLSDL